MALTIDLYQCEVNQLKQHIADQINVDLNTLEYYAQEMERYIDKQKIDDRQAGIHHHISFCQYSLMS